MNTRTAYAWFFFLLFTTGFFSCGLCSKKLACPGYKDEVLDSWFPYQDGQQLSFRSNTNEIETYTLINTETTAPYEARGGVYGREPYCEAQKIFQSQEKDSLGNSKASILLISMEANRQTNFSFGKYDFNISQVGENSANVNTRSRSLTISKQASVTLGNRTFTNLLEATGDTSGTKNAGVYKLYFAKGEGIIAYSEYPSLKTWVKQ